MRRASIAFALVLVAACNDSSPNTVAEEPRREPPRSIADLAFNDEELQKIAVRLREAAKLRHVDTSSGETRVERLLSLEAALDAPPDAMQRVNKLLLDMTKSDATQWARLRRKAEHEFCSKEDETSARVCDMLQRWSQRRTTTVMRYLSSNYSTTFIPSLEWERRFRDFVAATPRDAATWGWLVLGEWNDIVQQQYDRADAESAYRFYLEFSGLGTGREAREIFSVPGITINEPSRAKTRDPLPLINPGP